jgi:hypothetical protein
MEMDLYHSNESEERLIQEPHEDISLKSYSAKRREISFWRRWKWTNTFELDAIATQPSVFDDPQEAQFYQPRSDWENLHRFDPKARWTYREEYVRSFVVISDQCRISFGKLIGEYVFGHVSCLCIEIAAFRLIDRALELDRANISQANSDNFLGDLGLTTNGTTSTSLAHDRF